MHMQFNENPDNNYFFSQPHQPFFVLAFVNAIVMMLVFMLAYKGTIYIAIPSTVFHVYGLTYLLFTPAFFGFLFTTFPRFASTPTIPKKVYMQIFGFFYMGAALFILGSIVSPIFSGIGMLMVFGGQFSGMLVLRTIYKTTKMEDKHDIFWILTAMKLGVFAHLLFIIGQFFYASFIGFATEIAIYLYLFLLTFSVAQRMVPFFSHCIIDKNMLLLKVVFWLLVGHILLEGIYPGASFIVDLGLAALIGRELLRWKLPFPNPNPLLMVLHIALYWVPLAFLLGGLSSLVTMLSGINFLALNIHLLTLGFVFTILIGFGTRVTLGHSGNKMQADKWTTYLFYATQLVVILRLLVSLAAALGWNFMILFDITVTAWVLLLSIWAYRFFPVLISGKKLT